MPNPPHRPPGPPSQGELFAPISMACYYCDAEGYFDSASDAKADGWSEVLSDDGDAEWYTHTGYCPDCTLELIRAEIEDAG
jgi:hypothetical protein